MISMAREKKSLTAPGQGLGDWQPWKELLSTGSTGRACATPSCNRVCANPWQYWPERTPITQIQVLALSLLPLKARSSAALPEVELSLSCAFRRATKPPQRAARLQEMSQGRERPGAAFRHCRFPCSLQPGGTIRTCYCFPSHPTPQSPSWEVNPAPHTQSTCV